ncbi:HEPN domain-containing protein [Pedobacter ginsengisoli]|nr:HEPN domain-containing protein [Pedobacter ginsengisoli]
MTETPDHTYYGVWFLPEEQKKVQGYVRVTNFIIELHLTDPDGRQLTNKRHDSIDMENYPIIHGIGSYNERITLYQCSGFSGSFDVKIMLYGDQFYKPFDEQKFQILGVHVPLFDKWISAESFKRDIINTGFSITYNAPEEIECILNEEVKIHIQFECFLPTTENKNKINLHEFSLVHFVCLNKEGLALAQFFKYILHFQQLVSFLSRDGANVSAVRVYTDEKGFQQNKFLGTMVYGAIPFNKFEYSSSDHLHKFLITKNDIGTNLSSFFKKWFELANNAQHILNLVFHDYFHRGAFTENNFLNLIRVLEIYDAFKSPGTVMPEKDFKNKLDEIIAGVPEIYKKEVKEYLQYKNEFTLDHRLKRLVARTMNFHISFDYKYDSQFIIKVKNSRNYYTHYNSKRKKNVAFGDELMHLTESCRVLINYLLLKDLEVPESALVKRFEYYIESSFYSNYYL